MVGWAVRGIVALSASILYLLYRSLLPRPIPGIPHNGKPGLFGDIAALIKWQSECQEVYTFLSNECRTLGSPIIQLFLRPFGRPWVIICNADAAKEALIKRQDGFDRSAFFGDALHGVLRNHHVRMPTNQKMKAQRRMMSDTMSPSFLNEKAAPSIHKAVMDLIELWKVKARLAGPQRVFQVDVDLRHAILDALWPVALGTHPGTVKAQTEALKESSELPKTSSDVVEFPSFHVPETFEAMAGIADSVESILSSPFPAIHHWVLRQFPKLRAVFQVKERLITSSLQAALHRTQEGSKIQSAADLILSRALKTGTADINSPVVRDELFGFLVAGHDTTATTLAWGVKYLSEHPAVQEKLRRHMRQAWPQTKVPTAEDLVRTSVPYLDAVVEEIARCSGTQSAISRRTTKDVNIMNVLIPKGTDVFFMTNGPDFREVKIPAFPAHKRPSEEPRPGFWPDYTLGYFCPERWIASDGNVEQFVHDAGPSYPFGAGFRGCFGKRLARLQLRIVVAVLVSSFGLEEVPRGLSSFAAVDKLNHHPQQCYLTLREFR